jgi:hypothetical protein
LEVHSSLASFPHFQSKVARIAEARLFAGGAAMSDYKEYLGYVEFRLDDVIYELGLRELPTRELQGTWSCQLCSGTGSSSDATLDRELALEFAKIEARKHHKTCVQKTQLHARNRSSHS